MIKALTDFVNWQHFPAIIAVVVASIAAGAGILSSYITKKNQIALENRRMKQDMYFAYLDAIGDYGNKGKNKTKHDQTEIANKWVEAHNRLVLVGNAESIKAMMEI